MKNFTNHISRYRVLLNNSGWLLGVEILAKLSRVATIIALATSLSMDDYGVVVLALASYEIFRLLLRSGVGAQVVQCQQDDLPRVAGNGLTIQWGMSIAVTLLQVALAFPIGAFYQSPLLTELLLASAFTYLIFPIVCLRVFSMQRNNNMRQFSIRNGLCIVAENLSMAGFVLAGAGVYAMVWAKWVFALTWLLVFLASASTGIGCRFEVKTIKALLTGTSQLVGSELSRAVRMHMDVLIAGRLLSPELLGVYGFAKNAGVGLTHSLSQAFVSALYPYLCERNRQRPPSSSQRFAYVLAFIVGCGFIVQALLVPYYVPALFGERWESSLITTSILCLLALPAIFIDTRCTLLRATAKYKEEMALRVSCLIVSVASLLLIAPDSPLTFAFVLLCSAAAWLLFLLPFKQLHFAPFRSILVEPFQLFNRK